LTLVFYISGHGFGHASRQIEVINAVLARLPGVRIIIRTAAARWLFDRTLRGPAEVQPAICDTGCVQQGSLVVDVPATIRTAAAFHEHLEPRIDEEARLLEATGATLVIADMPPLAFAAAARAGVPAVGLGNFTWDWIYASYTDALPAAPWLIDRLAGWYALAREAWRLPLAGGFDTFPRIVDVPLVARHARYPRDEVRDRLGLPRETPLLLVSFGGYQSHELDLARAAAAVRHARIVITAPTQTTAPGDVLVVDESMLYGDGLRYEDLVGAVDIVLSKPGYGIVSECIANGTRLLYTPRGRFREYEVFVEQMPRLLPCEFLSLEELSAGRWNEAIGRLLARPATLAGRPTTNGASAIADRIASL
jgi:L-arabinokinase